MLRFIVEHKLCGCTRVVLGTNIWDALKTNNLDFRLWEVKSVEKIA